METHGLKCWRGAPNRMRNAHIHCEIELNLVASGEMVYLFGGKLVPLRAGDLAIFWGALPHQLVETSSQAESFWLTLPLPGLLEWNIESLSPSLLNGKLLVLESDGVFDEKRFSDWQSDLGAGDTQTVLLELEARLRRFARGHPSVPFRRPSHATRAELGHVEKMAAFVAQHYANDIALADIARAANLNVSYASTLFRREFGSTLGDFLLRTRLAHAQRLLATTDKLVGEVAGLSGFGSLARFHAAFKEKTGLSPRGYRMSVGNQS